jgi:charged multivesicular body protein 1
MEMTRVMDEFERQMENVSVQTSCMDTALSSNAAINAPPEEVSALMQQVADEHGLDTSQAMMNAGCVPVDAIKSDTRDELSERLAKLRNP